MKTYKTKPIPLDYWLDEFTSSVPNSDHAIDTALTRYLASNISGMYVELSFWAAALLGAQKRAISDYYLFD